jgi:hypothetical protein
MIKKTLKMLETMMLKIPRRVMKATSKIAKNERKPHHPMMILKMMVMKNQKLRNHKVIEMIVTIIMKKLNACVLKISIDDLK